MVGMAHREPGRTEGITAHELGSRLQSYSYSQSLSTESAAALQATLVELGRALGDPALRSQMDLHAVAFCLDNLRASLGNEGFADPESRGALAAQIDGLRGSPHLPRSLMEEFFLAPPPAGITVPADAGPPIQQEALRTSLRDGTDKSIRGEPSQEAGQEVAETLAKMVRDSVPGSDMDAQRLCRGEFTGAERACVERMLTGSLDENASGRVLAAVGEGRFLEALAEFGPGTAETELSAMLASAVSGALEGVHIAARDPSIFLRSNVAIPAGSTLFFNVNAIACILTNRDYSATPVYDSLGNLRGISLARPGEPAATAGAEIDAGAGAQLWEGASLRIGVYGGYDVYADREVGGARVSLDSSIGENAQIAFFGQYDAVSGTYRVQGQVAATILEDGTVSVYSLASVRAEMAPGGTSTTFIGRVGVESGDFSAELSATHELERERTSATLGMDYDVSENWRVGADLTLMAFPDRARPAIAAWLGAGYSFDL